MPVKSDRFWVPDSPVNTSLNSATNAASFTPSSLGDADISSRNSPHYAAGFPAINLTFETFSAKRRRLQSRPFASALANTNLLHNPTGGTIRASTPDGEGHAASSGFGTLASREWLTRMFHPPDKWFENLGCTDSWTSKVTACATSVSLCPDAIWTPD